MADSSDTDDCSSLHRKGIRLQYLVESQSLLQDGPAVTGSLPLLQSPHQTPEAIDVVVGQAVFQRDHKTRVGAT